MKKRSIIISISALVLAACSACSSGGAFGADASAQTGYGIGGAAGDAAGSIGDETAGDAAVSQETGESFLNRMMDSASQAGAEDGSDDTLSGSQTIDDALSSAATDDALSGSGPTDDTLSGSEAIDDALSGSTATDDNGSGGAGADDPASDAPIMNMTALDLEGNRVRLGDLIGQNRYTLINVWGTFCGPCIREMPDLAWLHEQYHDQGFGVIGLTCDVLDDRDESISSAVEDGRSIVEYTGAGYPIVQETMEMKYMFWTDVVPASYILDSHGNQIGDAVIGARQRSDWEDIIRELLSEDV